MPYLYMLLNIHIFCTVSADAGPPTVSGAGELVSWSGGRFSPQRSTMLRGQATGRADGVLFPNQSGDSLEIFHLGDFSLHIKVE